MPTESEGQLKKARAIWNLVMDIILCWFSFRKLQKCSNNMLLWQQSCGKNVPLNLDMMTIISVCIKNMFISRNLCSYSAAKQNNVHLIQQ